MIHWITNRTLLFKSQSVDWLALDLSYTNYINTRPQLHHFRLQSDLPNGSGAVSWSIVANTGRKQVASEVAWIDIDLPNTFATYLYTYSILIYLCGLKRDI